MIKTRSWFFEKINKISKYQARLIKKWQITDVTHGRNILAIETTDIKRKKECSVQLYAKKFDNLDEMGKYLIDL